MRDARLALVLALASAGCVSSRYAPRDSPWITTVREASMPRYRVGAHTYHTLAEATAAEPEAHALLVRGESDQLWGTVIASASSTVLSLGLTDLLLIGLDSTSLFGNRNAAIGIATLGVGLVGMVGGLVLATAGERDIFDAVNLFNDRMFERWQREHGLDVPAPDATPAPSDDVLSP